MGDPPLPSARPGFLKQFALAYFAPLRWAGEIWQNKTVVASAKGRKPQPSSGD
jgi:hypothetical protein